MTTKKKKTVENVLPKLRTAKQIKAVIRAKEDAASDREYLAMLMGEDMSLEPLVSELEQAVEREETAIFEKATAEVTKLMEKYRKLGMNEEAFWCYHNNLEFD